MSETPGVGVGGDMFVPELRKGLRVSVRYGGRIVELRADNDVWVTTADGGEFMQLKEVGGRLRVRCCGSGWYGIEGDALVGVGDE